MPLFLRERMLCALYCVCMFVFLGCIRSIYPCWIYNINIKCVCMCVILCYVWRKRENTTTNIADLCFFLYISIYWDFIYFLTTAVRLLNQDIPYLKCLSMSSDRWYEIENRSRTERRDKAAFLFDAPLLVNLIESKFFLFYFIFFLKTGIFGLDETNVS